MVFCEGFEIMSQLRVGPPILCNAVVLMINKRDYLNLILGMSSGRAYA